MRSITLQTSDNQIVSGDVIGLVNFAASAESDGGAAILIAGSIYSQGEGSFQSSYNPASLVFATSANDSLAASGKIKINHDGHILPMQDGFYSLGDPNFNFKHLYVDGITISGEYTLPTSDGSANQVLQTDGAGNLTFQSVTVSDISDLTATATELNLLDGVTNITLGSANELLVVGSDGASIVSDSTLAVDTSNNRLGINQTSPEVTLHMTGEGAQTSQIRMEQYNDSADAPDIRTRRYRGTIASPSGVQAGDYLFRSNHEYYNGTSLIVGGTFAFDNTNNANRTQFAVSVTTDGTSADANTPSKVQFKIDGNDSGAITFNNAYKFPTSDGSANQVLQTDGNGSLSFATVSTGSAYTAGSGLTLAGTQFNVYGGSGNFEYLEVNTSNNVIPKIEFTGSGVTDTPINLEVASSFESATGSGSALLFQGTQGQLFSITDNLSSGTIFSVSDITGLPMLEIDASGHVQIGEFADDITLHQAVLLSGGVPSSTTNKLYNNAGTLYWNGSTLTYDDAAISGYFESRVDRADADIATVSGIAVYASGHNLQSITDNGASTTNAITITNNNITASSGLFNTLDMTPLAEASYPAHQEGVVFYDVDNHTLSLYNDEADVTLQLGQEEFLRVRNNTGATIQNGTAVLINGAHGNAAPTISGAIANFEANSQAVGLATHSIETDSFGYVTTYGIVRDVDTSAFSAGDELFLSATEIGSGVNVSPTIPNYKVTLGHVIRSHDSNGSVLVQIGNSKLGGGDLKSEAPLNISGVPFVTSVADTTAGGAQTDPLFIFDSGNRQLQLGSGIQLLDGAPSNTSNVLYNDGGTLSFNGSAVNTDTDTTYTAGSGLTLVGTEFNTAGTGNFNEIRFSDSNNSVLISASTNIPTYSDYGVTIGSSAGGAGSGQYNTQVGRSAGANISGNRNTFIGTSAGNKPLSAQTRNYCTAIGYNSLSNGLYNVGPTEYFTTLGYEAGYAASGLRSVGIGYKSLYLALGDDNIEIVNDGTNSPLSYNNNGNLTSQNNKLHIGYTILGDTSDKKLAIGNVSFSNIDPDATLEILPKAATDVGLIVQAATSHSASLQEWQNSSETKLLAVGPDGGLEIPSNVPSTTTNKFYNNGGTLYFNGSAVNTDTNTTYTAGTGLSLSSTTFNLDFSSSAIVTEAEGISSNDNDTTLPTSAAVKDYVDNNAGASYTAGSGLTLVGTEFNIYGGSGQFREILFDDNFPIAIKSEGNSISSYGPDIHMGYAAAEGYTPSTSSTQDGNVIIGNNAASGASVSNRQVIIGYNTARQTAGGFGGIHIGAEAGHSMKTVQSQMIGIGYAALGMTSGCNALFGIGTNICSEGKSLISSNFIGHNAGSLSWSMSYCNSVGRSAGGSHKGGSYNNYFGDYAGIGASGSYNTGIGRNALAASTGNYNIELVTNGASTNVIGTNDNKLHIENTIIGDTSSKLLAIGNVGSADLTPDATLEIKPNAATDVGLIVQGATSQSADFVQFQTSSETVTSKIDSAGRLLFDIDTITTTPSTKGVGAYAKGVAVFDDNDGSMMAYFLRDGTDNYTRFNSNDVRLFAASASTNGVHLKSANTSFGTPTDGLAIYDNDGTTLGELKCDFVNVDINSASANGQKITAAASQTAELQIWENSSSTKLVAVGPDGGLELPNNVPSTTTNKLYNNAGTLTFNGSALGGGGISNIVEDTTPQLGGTLDANGNTIDMGTYVITDTKVGQWDTAYGWGDHGSAGYLTAHPTISAASSSDNSGRTYIQDIILDSNGHVTGLATATETVTDTTYTAGTGLTLSSTTFNANVNATTQTVVANTVSATSSRTYAVQVNASDELVVNVPWTDTDTNTQLSQEQVEDFAGNLIATGGTKTGITVTYQDSTNDVDFVVGGLTTTEIAAATLVTSAEGIGSNDNDTTIPTSAAVKAYADSVGGGGGGAVSAVANGADNRIATFSSTDALNGEANLTFDGSTLAVNGAFTATTKSFLINHPSKPGMKLQYASLEGPENGVYVRGTTKDTFITLPNYWRDLVHNSSITVTLTPVGSFQPLFVESKSNREIIVGGVCGYYDYVVWGERKDVEKLEVEW